VRPHLKRYDSVNRGLALNLELLRAAREGDKGRAVNARNPQPAYHTAEYDPVIKSQLASRNQL